MSDLAGETCASSSKNTGTCSGSVAQPASNSRTRHELHRQDSPYRGNRGDYLHVRRGARSPVCRTGTTCCGCHLRWFNDRRPGTLGRVAHVPGVEQMKVDVKHAKDGDLWDGSSISIACGEELAIAPDGKFVGIYTNNVPKFADLDELWIFKRKAFLKAVAKALNVVIYDSHPDDGVNDPAGYSR